MRSSLLRFALFTLILAAAGAASAKDKYVECIDPDIGKSCMECNQGGTQVCCPKEGTCTVNKGGLLDAPVFAPTACSERESQDPVGPGEESEQPS